MPVSGFIETCVNCSHKLGEMPDNCGCECHERIKLLAKFTDKSVEEVANDIKEMGPKLLKDPKMMIKWLVAKNTGFIDEVAKRMKDKVDMK